MDNPKTYEYMYVSPPESDGLIAWAPYAAYINTYPIRKLRKLAFDAIENIMNEPGIFSGRIDPQYAVSICSHDINDEIHEFIVYENNQETATYNKYKKDSIIETEEITLFRASEIIETINIAQIMDRSIRYPKSQKIFDACSPEFFDPGWIYDVTDCKWKLGQIDSSGLDEKKRIYSQYVNGNVKQSLKALEKYLRTVID